MIPTIITMRVFEVERETQDQQMASSLSLRQHIIYRDYAGGLLRGPTMLDDPRASGGEFFILGQLLTDSLIENMDKE